MQPFLPTSFRLDADSILIDEPDITGKLAETSYTASDTIILMANVPNSAAILLCEDMLNISTCRQTRYTNGRK